MVTVVYNDKSTILCIVAIEYIELIQKIGTVKKTNHLQSTQQHKFLYPPQRKTYTSDRHLPTRNGSHLK